MADRMAAQDEVIRFLADPRTHGVSDSVERFETHGNIVFLAGRDAWKIKRAVRFPYMDFSTLTRREAACRREVEVNRRFAPDIYLGCVPISRTPGGGLEMGGAGPAVEWAVHMRRFEQAALLSCIAERGGIDATLAKSVADAAYDSHQQARRLPGAPGAQALDELLGAVSTTLAALPAFVEADVVAFARAARRELHRAGPVLDKRARNGFVRRCHGDLHLANIVMWEGRPVFFDAIEFDERIATIDTLYDLAFLLMDLDRRGHRPAANQILNRYLWRGDQPLDLSGLAALPLFMALRAAIRAMVTAERAAQENADAARRDADAARSGMQAAITYASPGLPRLVAIGGLSGTGKSTIGARLAPFLGPSPGAVHLRSDLERKTLFGVGETARLPAEAYTAEVGSRVYDALRRKARLALAAGQSVIVDAVHARPEERAAIEAVAAKLCVPFGALWLEAERDDMERHVSARINDASDATPELIAKQLQYDVGPLTCAWTSISAGGTVDATLGRASNALGIHSTQAGSPRS